MYEVQFTVSRTPCLMQLLFVSSLFFFILFFRHLNTIFKYFATWQILLLQQKDEKLEAFCILYNELWNMFTSPISQLILLKRLMFVADIPFWFTVLHSLCNFYSSLPCASLFFFILFLWHLRTIFKYFVTWIILLWKSWSLLYSIQWITKCVCLPHFSMDLAKKVPLYFMLLSNIKKEKLFRDHSFIT